MCPLRTTVKLQSTHRSPKYGILCQIRLTLHRSLPAVPGRSYVPSTSVYPLRGTPGEPPHRTRLDSRRIRLPLLLYQQPVTGIIFSVFPAIPGTKGQAFICSFVNRATAFYPLLKEAQALSLIHISEPTRLGMISYAVFCLK